MTTPTPQEAEAAWQVWLAADRKRYKDLFGVEPGPPVDYVERVFKYGYAAALASARPQPTENNRWSELAAQKEEVSGG